MLVWTPLQQALMQCMLVHHLLLLLHFRMVFWGDGAALLEVAFVAACILLPPCDGVLELELTALPTTSSSVVASSAASAASAASMQACNRLSSAACTHAQDGSASMSRIASKGKQWGFV